MAIMRGEQKEFVRDGVRYSLSPNLFRFILHVRRHAKASEIINCHDTLSVLACLQVGRRVLICTRHHVLAERQLFRSGQEWSGKTGLGLGTGLKCSAARILGWGILKSVDRVIAVSLFTRNAVRWTYRVPASKIKVVYNGIDVDRFWRAEGSLDNHGTHSILFVRANEPRKGLHHLLEALPLVLDRIPEAELIVAGPEPSGSYGQYIRNLLEKHRITTKVVFTGQIPFDDLVSLYLSSHLVVVPSTYEGFGIVVLEAGACGRPVIASDIGGLNEAVVDGETGFLVNVKDPSLFAAAIVKVLGNDSLQQQLGRNARRRVLKIFTWHRICSQVEHVYQAAWAGLSRGRWAEKDTKGMSRLL